MKNFLVVTNQNKDVNRNLTYNVRDYLTERGATCCICDKYTNDKFTPMPIPENTDCILVIGGDGTLLSTATKVIGKNIPLLGINRGTLGFLAEVGANEIQDTLEHLLTDCYQIENRIMLKCEVFRDGKCINSYYALNDVVVTKSGYANVVGLTVSINETEIESYYADGVIVCTPTGSTAYNLSAGGPIINPTCKNYVITPICPHSLTIRSVVLAEDDIVTIGLMDPSAGRDPSSPILIHDGHVGIELNSGDEVRISKAPEVTPFIKMKKVSFAKILKEKIHKQ